MNVGSTISFDDHRQAVRHFLGRDCIGRNKQQCDDELPALLPDAARLAGYDSIQFVHHCDLCMHNGGCGHELLLLTAANGHEACPSNVHFRTGPGARHPCSCTASEHFDSPRGHACAVCAGNGF